MAPLPNTTTGILESFFRPISFPNAVPTRGDLISFNYVFWKHDPNPLIIIVNNDKMSDKVAGINLHLLTSVGPKSDVAELIRRSKRMDFSYRALADRKTFRDAYRTYKKSGIRLVRKFDTQFLLKVISVVRSFDPAEIQIIRRQVQEQIKQQINPKANQLTTLNQPEVGEIGG